MGKRVPHFWWDFRYEPDRIIVESNDTRFKVVKAWRGHSEANIARAQKLIEDLEQGRADPRRVK